MPKETILWQPSVERRNHSSLTKFAKKYNYASNFADFHAQTVRHPEKFWAQCSAFLGIKYQTIWSKILRIKNNPASPRAEWFSGCTLNFAENILAKCLESDELLTFCGENSVSRTVSSANLLRQVRALAQTLKAHGVKAGTRCAAIATNSPETIIAMLACAQLGAVWSSCSPDFGASGILDRFAQIAPTVLFASPGYFWKGAWIDCCEKISTVTVALPSLKLLVALPYRADEDRKELPSESPSFDSIGWHSATSAPELLGFTAVEFDAPLYIMFSSGTTGKPKCIVHSVGGTLVEHLKEWVLHTDLKPGDRMLYHTTCGWMMWNLMVSALGAGASLVLFDGSPLEQDAKILFNFVAEKHVTCFGTSAKFIALAEKEGIDCADLNLASLHTILSTGSPLLPESFDFVYSKIKKDVCLSSIAGGTDIIGCFTLGNPWSPVVRGMTQGLSLGLDVQIWNEHGKRVYGEKGELVCVGQFPSMPIGFFGDDQAHTKYRKAYFQRFPGVWHHGDYVEEGSDGRLTYYGRSDAVLNPGGVRIGSAEIYQQVESLPEITESGVVGQNFEGDVRIVLFVKLRAGLLLTPELRKKIVKTIRENTSPFHVPKIIDQVTDIPRTRSGKIAELAVRDILEGRTINNEEALANPECLAEFRLWAKLRHIK